MGFSEDGKIRYIIGPCFGKLSAFWFFSNFNALRGEISEREDYAIQSIRLTTASNGVLSSRTEKNL